MCSRKVDPLDLALLQVPLNQEYENTTSNDISNTPNPTHKEVHAITRITSPTTNQYLSGNPIPPFIFPALWDLLAGPSSTLSPHLPPSPPLPGFPCKRVTPFPAPNHEDHCLTRMKSVNDAWDKAYPTPPPVKKSCITFGQTSVIPPDTNWPQEVIFDSRRGPWIQLARDRSRFSRRILNCDPKLSTVLTAHHRELIFQQRFK